ncbi:MAG TPA: fibronectin type III domain-containing protein, partial [Vicinamibacterales bacterium]|nr:fibronectin type III domain-containing protein [Vicinamibacterales bacterium]
MTTAAALLDSTPPTSTITSIDSGMTVAAGRPFTISGTASDGGGGIVVRVEVSLDGGLTWRQATGGTSWSYTWTPAGVGTVILRSRAVDDSNNVELPSAGTMVDVVAAPDPNAGPGGPVLVVTSAANPFTYYYAEILRAEGLNAFGVADIATVTPQNLAAYDVVILGEMALSPSQVTVFSNWVTGGGNLIAMRPDKQLYSLLGLTDANATLSNAYVLFNTTSGPGLGLVASSIQFHGAADRATLNGASGLAMLYSDPTTATTNPAVTLRSVGVSGGQAAAFLYDLARSVVYTRQGNPAWSGQERDGIDPIRSSDLFYGASVTDPQPDWVNLNKVEIPQADEHQRLLANLVLQVSADRKPLPRFWYFPRGEKAVVVMTGDDHATGGTAGRFEQYKAFSAPGCSVADWECIRSTSYIYPNPNLTDSQAVAYNAQGFEVWMHLNTNCTNWADAATLAGLYDTQIATMRSTYPSLPSGVTHRAHCIAWSDYATQPRVELERGIRFDTNYYYWPKDWVANRPGFFTGSGMPMRFADVDINGIGGTMIDVYQAATQMTDESGQTYSFTVDRLLDKALGPEGFYGAFTTNMHTDLNTLDDPKQSMASSNAIIASAQTRGVPVVSSRQMLEWLDGRNSSSFGTITWNASTLGFTVTVGAGGRGLQAMLPARSGALMLTNLTRGGVNVPFVVETVKGIEYAIFSASHGSYAATYAADTFPPVISAVTATPNATTAVITWSTNEISTSGVVFATSPSLGSCTTDTNSVTSHNVTVSGLAPTTTYYYRVCSTDPLGNAGTAPPVGDPPRTFTTLSLSFIDTTFADFSAGTPGTSTYVSQTGDGEVILPPQVGAEFSGTALPTGWSSTPWTVGGSATVSNGVLTVDGARVNTDAFYSPGHSLEIMATFTGDVAQHIGFGQNLAAIVTEQWALFSTRDGGQGLWARTNVSGIQTETQILTAVPSGAHRYRIDWNANSILYYFDGALVATHAVVITSQMRPIAASDFFVSQGTVIVDWVRMGSSTSPGTFVSRVFDAGAPVFFGALSWTSQTPAGTTLALSVRTGGTPTPDPTWSSFVPVAVSGGTIGGSARYIQYQAQLSTSVAATPVLEQVAIGYSTLPPGPDSTPPTISDISATAEETATISGDITVTSTTATIAWNTNEPASSAVAYGTSPQALTNTVANATLVALHSMTLTGLSASTTYYYRITSTDGS